MGYLAKEILDSEGSTGFVRDDAGKQHQGDEH
jgi:hypothetical protein